MKAILWMSLRAPYDTVPHAGGKIHNFYLKKFHESNFFDITLISFCSEKEKDKLDLNKYSIKNEVFVLSSNLKSKNLIAILSHIGLPISLLQYITVRNKVKITVKNYKARHYKPEIIILQWTEIVLLLPYLRKIYPNCKFVCIEEDVTFQKLERKWKKTKGIKSLIYAIQYEVIKRNELKSLSLSNLVVLNNPKDQKLVVENDISFKKTFVSIPYYQDYSNIIRCPEKSCILFYGAMNRPENIESVFWIIDNVLPKLFEKNPDICFVVLGANPPDSLKKKSNKNIVVTGFVADITPFFEKCLCMVAPLQMGAGVKIKIIEGMSAGIPVLTNNIGIEGIPAKNKKEYLHCESPEEYIAAIISLTEEKYCANEIGLKAKKFICQNYDKDISIKNFINKVRELPETIAD